MSVNFDSKKTVDHIFQNTRTWFCDYKSKGLILKTTVKRPNYWPLVLKFIRIHLIVSHLGITHLKLIVTSYKPLKLSTVSIRSSSRINQRSGYRKYGSIWKIDRQNLYLTYYSYVQTVFNEIRIINRKDRLNIMLNRHLTIAKASIIVYSKDSTHKYSF